MFTLTKLLRPILSRHQAWLGKLCRIAARLLVKGYAGTALGARPELVLFVQSFEDLVNFNPCLLAADGVFLSDGAFVALPLPKNCCGMGFGARCSSFCSRSRRSRTGFDRACSAGGTSVGFAHTTGCRWGRRSWRQTAARRLHAPGADAAREDELRCSHRHGNLPREDAPGAQEKLSSNARCRMAGTALLCKHIPVRYEHLVHYVGFP